MKSYQQYCPIALGAEIFAERWTPLIIRNLVMGCETFTEIREGAPGIPKTLLSQRLQKLAHAAIVETRPNASGRGSTYHLTDMGRELGNVCFALGAWGAKWLEVGPEHVDTRVVLWSMSRLIDRGQMPEPRIVIRFDVTDAVPEYQYWLVIERDAVEVCFRNPGFEERLVVTTTATWLARWHMGHISLADAQRRRLIDVVGPPALVRAMATWGLSPFAHIEPFVPAQGGTTPRSSRPLDTSLARTSASAIESAALAE
jgi:DNA-binding HxlR family transcriptional regulator